MWLAVSIFAHFLYSLQCAKILAVLPYPSASHQNVYKPILEELLNRGHEITIITTIKYKFSKHSVYQIYLPKVNNMFNNTETVNAISKEQSSIRIMFSLEKMFTNFFEKVLVESKKHLSTESVDLIILEALHPLVFGYSCMFNVPIIGITPNSVPSFTNNAIGNPLHLSLHPELFFNVFGKLSLYHRFKSVLLGFSVKIAYHLYALPKYNNIISKHIGSCPSLHDFQKNMSLLFFNNNPFTHRIRPLVPISIEMGSFLHLHEPKALPEDLQTFLDRSSNGVIYFSLGSILNSCYLPQKTVNILLEAFQELPYNVIWRDDCMKSLRTSKKILVDKNFPQQDLLRHKNVKVFINHGGLQSIEEAIINEVPIIGLPLALDQPYIIQRLMELGVCLGINYEILTKNEFKDAITSTIINPIYKNKIIEIKKILLDKPQQSLDKVVWWIEYVIRHNGTKFLRNQEIDMSVWEYYYLDVTIVAALILSCSIYLINNIFKTCCLKVKQNKKKTD